MKKRVVFMTTLMCSALLSTFCNVAAKSIQYLPDVKKEMSYAGYWTTDKSLLMTMDEILLQNSLTVSTKETCMYDLKNQPEVVDTVALNKALQTSSKADADYYLGWTYLESDEKATEADYELLISNTQNPEPKENDAVRYGIATRRTNLHTFPSDVAIWDDYNDLECNYQYLVSVNVNEPLVITSVSEDKKFYLAKSICCSGWVPAEDVAICADKEEWLSAWDIPAEKSLLVYGDKVYTEMSASGKETSELLMTMGTVLELADGKNPNELIDNRATYQNYVVYIPVREEDGTYSKKLTLISESEKVHPGGYLPLTRENIVKIAFEALGNTYGWGNWLNADDCSGYIRNIYKCFGLELARNTTWQAAMPMAKVDMKYMCREERLAALNALPAGTILFFSGHEMMYLGRENGKYYVISSAGSMMQPENPSVRQRIRSVVINTLEVKRANGNTWLDELTAAVVPYLPVNSDQLPPYAWYRSGVSFCIKNNLMQGDENKYFNPDRTVTWAELLQILFNMEGRPEQENINQENWYDSAVNWAKELDLIHEADKEFMPGQVVSREEVASVLYRYGQTKGVTSENIEAVNLSLYSDAGEVSDYAVEAMQYALNTGIMVGKTQNTINPKDNTTRAEIAVICTRFFGVVNNVE